MTLYMLFATTGMLAYAVGLELAFFATLLLAPLIVLFTTRLVSTHAAIVTLVFGSAVTITIAATRQPGEPLAAARSNGSAAVVVAADSALAQAAGEQLFRELGCVRCHRPDGEGIGPSLTGVFGRPVPYPGSGAPIADEEYVRESILNPSATVADGFAPVMPAFAGKVTEDQLLALIAHLKSLKGNTP
jgi:cytochrome c2